jgi:LysR family transcriptional regulator, glycine cleavage system transcriptional activator
MLSSRPQRLPPLAALRAFDAVARHRSIQAAAAELGVSAAAVSQHVKALEADLGVSLLYRRHRGVALTASGRRLAPNLMAGFASLATGVALMREDGHSGKLTVSAAPSLATKWLVPRLDGLFQAAHPEIEVQVIADGELCDFARDGVDIALRHGLGGYPGCVSHELLPAILTPVCAPWMARDLTARGSPADLLGYLLLHDANCEYDPPVPGWVDWFAAAGVQNAAASKGPRFSDTHLALEPPSQGKA